MGRGSLLTDGDMNQIDLTTDFLGFRLCNPLIAASGPPTKDFASIQHLVKAGIGAVITKTILLEPSVNPSPCLYRGAGLFLNTERCSTIPLATWLTEEIPRLAELPIPIIANIGMTPAAAAELAKPIVDAGADILELSVFTPYDDPGPMVEALQRVKNEVSVPVLVKLSCNVHDLVEFGLVLRNAGADGFSAIDALKAGLALDIKTGAPVMMEQGFGRMSGEAIKPLALYHIAQLARYVGLPIVGTGGVMSAEDALEMVYCGAQTVGLCTSLIVGGPDIATTIHDELASLLARLGYTSLAEVRGKTLSIIDFTDTIEERREYEKRIWKDESRLADIDQSRCIRCERCVEICPYHAVALTEAGCTVLSDRCQSCGLCVSICPVQAINYTERGDG